MKSFTAIRQQVLCVLDGKMDDSNRPDVCECAFVALFASRAISN